MNNKKHNYPSWMLMESVEGRSYGEELEYYKELAEIEKIEKQVKKDEAVKKPANQVNKVLDPATNYKLIYR